MSARFGSGRAGDREGPPRPLGPVLLALGLVTFAVPFAGGASLRRQCRLGCKAAIRACIEAGGKRRRCRRVTLRRCRSDGLTVCASTTTTTAAAGETTTTTLPDRVNGCDPGSAVDLRARAQVTVRFGTTGLSYDPACFTVSPGTQLTFSGDFGAHPLVGGTVSGGAKIPDPSNPLGGPTSMGMARSFTLADPGVVPFYCNVHALIGMKGAAFVEP